MEGGVRKRGDTWYYYFEAGKVNGKRKKVERKGGKTKKEALDALRKALTEFDNCGSHIDESNISVADYFDYWFKEYVLINCKYNTQCAYKNIIDKHINPSLGIYKLKTVVPNILQEFINKKFLNGFSKNSVSNFFGVLSGAFRMAVYPYKYIKQNPMEFVQMPKYAESDKTNEEIKILTLTEFNLIAKRFPEGSSFYIPLQIAFHTGMRASEVCGLTWDFVDIENKTIKVARIILKKNRKWVFGSPKTETSKRTIEIGDTLIAILKHHNVLQKENKLRYGEFYTKSDFVCTKENGDLITTDSLKYLSRVVNYELGINFNFHALRHTHATMLLEAGANIKDIQLRLGHSRLATTMDTYSHVTQKMKRESVQIFENIISTHNT